MATDDPEAFRLALQLDPAIAKVESRPPTRMTGFSPQPADYKFEPEVFTYPTTNGTSIDPHLGDEHAQQNSNDITPMLQHVQDVAVASIEVSDAATHAATQAAIAAATQSRHKQTRVAQACDACSQRKVKCDATQPCRNCQDLGVECTRHRERRRRGPTNKVKERMENDKRQRTEVDADVSTALPTQGNAHTFGLTQTSTDLIAPHGTISQLLTIFYTYVYPVHPFPHETWLMQTYQRRADIGSNSFNPFLALIASMVGAVASLRPRATEGLIRELGYADLSAFVERARSICINAQGLGYHYRTDRDPNDAATSYFLAIMALRVDQKELYNTCLTDASTIIVNWLYTSRKADNSPKVDEIKRQTGLRICWAIYNLARSNEHLNWQGIWFLTKLPLKPYTKYPAPVSDASIAPDSVFEEETTTAQAPCTPSLSLIAVSQIYAAGETPLVRHPTDFIQDRDLDQLRDRLFSAPSRVRQAFSALDSIVLDLVNNHKSDDQQSDTSAGLEIQKTSIMLASLQTRMNVLHRAKQYLTSPDAADYLESSTILATERDIVARGLLFLGKDLTITGLEPDIQGSIDLIKRIIDLLIEEEQQEDQDVVASGKYGEELRRLHSCLVAYDEHTPREEAETAMTLLLKGWQVDFASSPLGIEISHFE